MLFSAYIDRVEQIRTGRIFFFPSRLMLAAVTSCQHAARRNLFVGVTNLRFEEGSEAPWRAKKVLLAVGYCACEIAPSFTSESSRLIGEPKFKVNS